MRKEITVKVRQREMEMKRRGLRGKGEGKCGKENLMSFCVCFLLCVFVRLGFCFLFCKVSSLVISLIFFIPKRGKREIRKEKKTQAQYKDLEIASFIGPRQLKKITTGTRKRSTCNRHVAFLFCRGGEEAASLGRRVGSRPS
jgi:hypothetical protein